MSQPKGGTAKEKSIQDAIAEKKKKLQELKNQSAARSAAAPTPAKRAPPGSANRQSITWNTADMDPDDLLKDVDSLLEKDTPSGVTSPASKDSKGQSVASPAPSSDSKDPPSSTTKKAQARSVTLSSTRPAHVDIAGVQRVTYDRDVQTEFQLSAADLDKKDQQVAEELRQERERLRSREQEINKIMATVSEERRKQEAAIEAAKPKDISAADRNRIVESKEFAQFFARSSTVMERFLDLREQEYDFTVDYTADTEQKIETKVVDKVVRKYTFEDAKLGSRPVTSLNWSPKYPELLLASYMKQAEDSLSLDPDGTVLIWNLHMTSRPEYHFQCQSGILSAQFHPSNPKLIIASTWTGQIVMFDMRENKSSPVNRTSLSRGHNHPVYAMRTVPLVNRLHNIVSVSTDGHLCAWSDNSLHEPSLELDLKAIDTGDTKRGKDEVTTNSFAFPGRDTNTIVLGSDEGVLYKARLYDKPGTTEMAGIYAAAQAHDAPITGVEFHPVMPKAPSYISDLFLTSSYDWTVKLWSHRSDKPLLTFESARDYVFDVQWSPVHPALFATGDGTGRMDIWNISGDADVPEVKLQLEALPGSEGQPPAISRVRWADDGNSIALGTSAGAVHVYAVDPSVAQPGKDTATNFFNKMQKLTS